MKNFFAKSKIPTWEENVVLEKMKGEAMRNKEEQLKSKNPYSARIEKDKLEKILEELKFIDKGKKESIFQILGLTQPTKHKVYDPYWSKKVYFNYAEGGVKRDDDNVPGCEKFIKTLEKNENFLSLQKKGLNPRFSDCKFWTYPYAVEDLGKYLPDNVLFKLKLDIKYPDN